MTALKLETLQFECSTKLQRMLESDELNEAEVNQLRLKMKELGSSHNLGKDFATLERKWAEKYPQQQQQQREKKIGPAVPKKPTSPTKVLISSTDLVTQANRLREQISSLSRNLTSNDNVVGVKAEFDKLKPAIIYYEELDLNMLKANPEQLLQTKRVVNKLLDEWGNIGSNLSQMLAKQNQSPVRSRESSESPMVMSPIPTPTPDEISEIESWLDDTETLLRDWKVGETGTIDKKNMKELEDSVARRHR